MRHHILENKYNENEDFPIASDAAQDLQNVGAAIKY